MPLHLISIHQPRQSPAEQVYQLLNQQLRWHKKQI
jgi:hypothetical protein